MSIQISIRLPDDVLQELDSVAKMEDCSRAKVIRDAIRLYLRDMRIINAFRDVDKIGLKALEKMFAKRDRSER
jgi:metal-responsive CopG/Arc/MetJ family transcriptional regulator